jgi:hypothetical protein
MPAISRLHVVPFMLHDEVVSVEPQPGEVPVPPLPPLAAPPRPASELPPLAVAPADGTPPAALAPPLVEVTPPAALVPPLVAVPAVAVPPPPWDLPPAGIDPPVVATPPNDEAPPMVVPPLVAPALVVPPVVAPPLVPPPVAPPTGPVPGVGELDVPQPMMSAIGIAGNQRAVWRCMIETSEDRSQPAWARLTPSASTCSLKQRCSPNWGTYLSPGYQQKVPAAFDLF